MEIKRLTTLEELVEYLDFIVESITVISTKNREPLEVEKALVTIRKNIKQDNFGVWIGLLRGQPVTFTVVNIGVDIHGNEIGYVWMARALPEADSKEGFKKILAWFHKKGVKQIQASNLLYTDAKQRWLDRFGFKKLCEVYQKEI